MTLLIELAVKSTVVAGATLALLALLGRRSAAERSWVGHAALVILAALPAAVILLPRWRLLPPAESASVLPAMAGAPASTAPAAIDPSIWLQALYAGGVALLLLATVVAILRLVGLRRGAVVLTDPDWLTALARAQTRMKVRSTAALLVSTALTSPVSWGLIRPTIVVNEGLVPSKHDAEAVIAHELAHVIRRDWVKLIGARMVTAIFWFNPLVWVLASQCHQLREEAADDVVLGAEVPSADYASLLVEAARHEGRGLIAAHGVAPGKGSLHRRVTRVLDAAARRTPTPAAWAIGVVAVGAVLAAPLAAATVERAEPSAVTIRSAQAAGTPPRPIVVPRDPDGAARFPQPIRPRASTIPPKPVVAHRKVDHGTTPPPPVVIPRTSGRAPATHGPTLTRPAAPVLTTVREAAPRKGEVAGAPVFPRPVIAKPAAPTVTFTAPRAPKVAIAAASPRVTNVFGKPGGVLALSNGLTLANTGKDVLRIEGGPAISLTAKDGATASSSVSHTLTTNGKTVRIETDRRDDPADRADRRENERDRLEDERDRLRDERDRRADEQDRRQDEADRRANQAEKLRNQREAQRDVERAVERQIEKDRDRQARAAQP